MSTSVVDKTLIAHNWPHSKSFKYAIRRELLLAFVSIAVIYLGHKAGVSIGLGGALLLSAVVVWYKRRPLWQARICVLVLCSGSDVIAYLYGSFLVLSVIISSIYLARWTVDRLTVPFWMFLGLAVTSWGINQIIERNFLSFPLWTISFLALLGVFFYFRRWPLTDRSLYKLLIFLVCVALLQCLIAYVDYISGVGFRSIWSLAATPDRVTGTFRTASNFGLFLLMALAWCYTIIVTHRASTKVTIWAAVTGLILLLFIYTADAKTYLGAFIIGFFTALFLNYQWRIYDRATKVVVMFIIALILLSPSVIKHIEKRYNEVYFLYLEGSKNNKVQFIERALNPSNRSLLHWLIGFGPGTCGSRAANMRAYDTLYKNEMSEARKLKQFIPAYSSKCTRQFLADLYDWHYAETASGRSALLGNPFNSWTALWFELGLVGIGLWGWFFIRILSTCRALYRGSSGLQQQIAMLTSIAIIAVIVSGIITQTLETPTAMMLLWFLAAHTWRARYEAMCL